MKFCLQSIITTLIIAWLLSAGCVGNSEKQKFQYPESKIWAHRVNDTATARKKGNLFCGIESDIFYSDFQKKIFVCHDVCDTTKNIKLEDIINALPNPQRTCYWLDLKNTDSKNADEIISTIHKTLETFRITSNVYIETSNKRFIEKIKKYNLSAMLWVEDVAQCKDSCEWIERTKKSIKEVKPDAISGNYKMEKILTNSFPEMNIHLWQTPSEFSKKNVLTTQKLIENNSVKIILVDYDTPDLNNIK